jgi:hypothetical protein
LIHCGESAAQFLLSATAWLFFSLIVWLARLSRKRFDVLFCQVPVAVWMYWKLCDLCVGWDSLAASLPRRWTIEDHANFLRAWRLFQHQINSLFLESISISDQHEHYLRLVSRFAPACALPAAPSPSSRSFSSPAQSSASSAHRQRRADNWLAALVTSCCP